LFQKQTINIITKYKRRNEAKSLDRNMFWYDNIDAKLLEIKPLTGNNRYLLQNGKTYKTTIFAL
jgi:hypothetical protein